MDEAMSMDALVTEKEGYNGKRRKGGLSISNKR